MATNTQFYKIAEAVAGENADDATYLMVLEAVHRGYNLRAIEEREED